MEESDDAIRRAVLSGDKDAYKVLMARYSQVVFRVAYRITGNESDAEETVQEAFLRAYQGLANFAGRSSMATWFYRIGANCALDMVSRRRPEAQSRIAEENDSEQSEVQLADIKAGPDRLLLSREIEARQQAAMSELTRPSAPPSYCAIWKTVRRKRLQPLSTSLPMLPSRQSFARCRNSGANSRPCG